MRSILAMTWVLVGAALFCVNAVGEALAQSALADGLRWQASYTAELWRNAQGGERRGEAYIDHAVLAVAWGGDHGSLSRWIGAQASLTYDNGGSISALAGDTHGVSNVEATHALRLYEAWVELGDIDRERTVKLGFYDLSSEFDASETSSMFVNTTFATGLDLAQSGQAGPSISPLTAFAFRGKWRFGPQWLLQATLLDGVPGDPEHPRRFQSLNLSSAEGALGVIELEHRRGEGRWVLGYWRYSAQFARLHEGVAPGGDVLQGRGNSGAYGFADFPLGGAEGWGWRAVLRFGQASPRFNAVDVTAQAALVRDGGLLGHSGEQLGIALANARFGTPTRNVDEALTRNESLVELSWRLPISKRIVIQPDLQYVLNSGGRRRDADTVVVGVRVDVDLSPSP